MRVLCFLLSCTNTLQSQTYIILCYLCIQLTMCISQQTFVRFFSLYWNKHICWKLKRKLGSQSLTTTKAQALILAMLFSNRTENVPQFPNCYTHANCFSRVNFPCSLSDTTIFPYRTSSLLLCLLSLSLSVSHPPLYYVWNRINKFFIHQLPLFS